jgi:hypothetical protein
MEKTFFLICFLGQGFNNIIKIIRSVHNQFFIYYARLVSSIAYTHFQGSFVEKTEKTAAKPKIQYGNEK